MFRRLTVHPGTVVLEYVRGEFTRTLGSGRHAIPWRARHVVVDMRERLLPVAPQEILTADGLSVRVSSAVRLAVADARAFHEVADGPHALVYLATQVALRDALGGLTAEELTRRGDALPSAQLTGAADTAARPVGLVVREVVVKDVILPPEVRAAATELVTARARGMARLESARAETAALRSLANGAKVLAANPALARLRMVQEAVPGTTLVLQLREEPETSAVVDS